MVTDGNRLNCWLLLLLLFGYNYCSFSLATWSSS